MRKVWKKQTIQIPEMLNAQLERACIILEVSKKNLVLFLISNSYDELLEKKEDDRKRLIKSALENYKKRMEKAEINKEDYRRRKEKNTGETPRGGEEKYKRTESFKYLCFEIGKFVDGWLEEWSENYHFSRKELIIALIEHSVYIIDLLLFDYKCSKENTDDAKYTFEKDKLYFLKCIGISQKDFSRLSEAVVLYKLFRNSSTAVRVMTSYECNTYIVPKEETKEGIEEKKKDHNKRKQRLVEILRIIEETEEAEETEETEEAEEDSKINERMLLAEKVLKILEKKERSGIHVILDSRLYTTKRRYKSRKKEDKKDYTY